MVKKALCYVQGTKGLMLTYRRSDSLEIEGYSDSDFAGDIDDENPHQVMYPQCMQNLWHVMRPPGRLNG